MMTDIASLFYVSVARLMTRSVVDHVEVEFTADHPFLFCIVDKFIKMPLFSGTVIDPSVS
jgi:serine protease inhibitor